MRSLTLCKLTSVKINCFAHIAYIDSFTDYHRRIFACVGFIALRCVEHFTTSQCYRPSEIYERMDLNAYVDCRNSLMTAQQAFKGVLVRVCGKTSETRPISPLHPSCVIVLPKFRENEKGTEPLQPTANPLFSVSLAWITP